MAFVTLARFRDPLDAELAKTRLEGAGIEAVILDQHLTAINWFYSIALGGVKVQVDESDLEDARRALREDHSEDLADIPESHLPAEGDDCPRCGSSRIRGSRAQRHGAALSLATGLPLVPWRRSWICEACGHQWEWAHEAGGVRAETLEAEARVHERRRYPLVLGYIAIFAALLLLLYVQHQIRSPS